MTEMGGADDVYEFSNGVAVFRRHLLEIQIARYQSEGNSNRHEPEEEDWLARVLGGIESAEPSVFDVGAGIGYYALLVLKLRPSAKIKAFEPLPEHFAALQENLTLNQVSGSRVSCVNEAAYDRNGVLAFEKLSYSSHLIDSETPISKGEQISVTARDVAEIIRNEPVPVDLMKIDIQGSEVALLERIVGTDCSGLVKNLIIGTHGQERHDRCLEIAKNRWRIIHEDPAPEFQMDGLIVASI